MSRGVGCRLGLDPVLLWLWCRPAATAPIRPLEWEPPYAVGVAQEMAKRKKKERKKRNVHLEVQTKSHIYRFYNKGNTLGTGP